MEPLAFSPRFSVDELNKSLARIEAVLQERLNAIMHDRHNSTGDTDLYARVHKYTMRPSKRLRPLLAMLTARACSPQFDSFGDLAHGCYAALEFAHTAILVHDDVIDNDLERSGTPSISVAAEHAYGSDAASVAIMTGDVMFALAPVEILREYRENSAELRAQLAMLLLKCTARTSEGQIEELRILQMDLAELDLKTVESAYAAKTNPTSAELPMLMGAIAAGAPHSVRAAIRKAAVHIGTAFQIMNDLVSFRHAQQNPNEEFDPRSMTLPFCYMYEEAPDFANSAFRERCTFAKVEANVETASIELQLLTRIDELFATAKTQIARHCPLAIARELIRVVDFLKELYTPGSDYWSQLGRYNLDEKVAK